MTPQEKIKALAELDGKWSTQFPYVGHQEFEQAIYLPDYLISYDAIIPLILKQRWMIQCEVAIQLRVYWQKQNVSIPTMSNLEGWCAVTLCSTPIQLADALLNATGKMKP